jgi:hypothetical protein
MAMESSDSEYTSSWSTNEFTDATVVGGEDLLLHKAAYLGDVHQLKEFLYKFNVNQRGTLM